MCVKIKTGHPSVMESKVSHSVSRKINKIVIEFKLIFKN